MSSRTKNDQWNNQRLYVGSSKFRGQRCRWSCLDSKMSSTTASTASAGDWKIDSRKTCIVETGVKGHDSKVWGQAFQSFRSKDRWRFGGIDLYWSMGYLISIGISIGMGRDGPCLNCFCYTQNHHTKTENWNKVLRSASLRIRKCRMEIWENNFLIKGRGAFVRGFDGKPNTEFDFV